jgi:hypothetical protein
LLRFVRLGILALLPVPAMSAPAVPPLAQPWSWHDAVEAGTVIDIDLIHADVTVTSATNDALVRIRPTGESAEAVVFSARSTAGSVRIRDTYPTRSPYFTECLPPVDERGDYWTYRVPLKVSVAVPRGAQLRIRLKSGAVVIADGVRVLDARTDDGTVTRLPNARQHPD